MDRGQGPARLLAAAALLLAVAADRPRLPIREARWLKSPDLVADLTQLPSECLDWPDDPAQRESVAIGRAAFRSPLLLGGQAARAGLSCASCHRNGRTNPHFHFPGISGDPGTADVTASIMSEHRGDGVFNPKPIPDLGGDPAKLKVSRDPARKDLERFIHGLIVEEFDGPEPPPAILDGVAAYVRRLSPQACPRGGTTPITLDDSLFEVDTAMLLAEESLKRGDAASARVLIASARSALGRIDERFTDARSHRLLRSADADLRALRDSTSYSAAAFERWRRAWTGRKLQLRAGGARSLFAEKALRRLVN
ncbi:MAG TPA: hypothetical protein VF079_03495 [Sphingomicrobium sp.]